ncbi:MAG: hypothetical protein HND47_19210 [Chloroflexi bacterium]|nr:hypothetical protein [Chloroflexota bacterium]
MTTLDPERQKQAKQYARIRRRLWLAETAFSAIYALAWLFLGWSVSLRTLLTDYWLLITDDWSLITDPLVIVLYVIVFGGIYFVLNLPLGYYSGFVLPKRFGQSNQTLKGWVVDQLKGLAIGAPIGLILLELLYLALRLTGDAWWLWAAGGLLLFNVILSNLAPVLIMPLFNKYVPLGGEHKDLEARLLGPCQTREHQSARRLQVRYVPAHQSRQRRIDRHRQHASHHPRRHAHQRIYAG